tara:strand:- start:21236 stop:22108 length:873 start_codon:yes stop_codon:yes gene_type:complete
MSKADNLPSPVEVLQKETANDEAELTKLKEEAEKPQPDTEELAEESLPSEDNDESETEEESVQPSEEKEEHVVEEQEPELSKRGQERFRKISEERRQALADLQAMRQEKENLLSMVQALQDQGLSKGQAEQAAASGYIDPNQYSQDVARNAQAIVNQTLAQREKEQTIIQAEERFREDLKVMEEKHPELDEDHPEYEEELAFFISDIYQSRFEKNPKTRLPEVVSQVMKLRGKATENALKEQVGKVAKQASKQAMSPSSGKTDTSTLSSKLAEVDSYAELDELRKLLPQE